MTDDKSTEYRGVGQSGYAAGRHEADRALEAQSQVLNATSRRGSEEEELNEDLRTDDRWTGRGDLAKKP